MTRKRYIVELGTGVDLHGMNVTKAACRAVRDAIGRSCLCGLVEILGQTELQDVQVDILIACPFPEQLDSEAVKAEVPIGIKTVRAELGGMQAAGLCVKQFGEDCDTIIVANAAVTVSV
ncbi:MAG: Lin0512 family protein [Desulfoferrobacter sp.]